MAIREHTPTDWYQNDVSKHRANKTTSPKGRPINTGEIDPEVLKALKPHPSHWRQLSANEARGLGDSANTKFFSYQHGKWEVARDAASAQWGEQWLAFVAVASRQSPAGGGGGGGNNRITSLYQTGTAPKAYVNLEPSVTIASPRSGSQLKLNESKYFKNQLVEHTFTDSDTVSSVSKQYSGSENTDAIYNFNHPSFTRTRPPQTGDRVRVLTGQELKVEGTVQNSPNVKLLWQGPTTGNLTIGNTQGGNNEIIGWQTAIPAKPGMYTLMAQTGKASSTVSVEVIDPTLPEKEKIAVRIGVFFDGTGNNMSNDLADGTDTNIVRLYELYNGTPEKLSPSPIGRHEGLDLYTAKVYQNGVGTKDGEPNSDYGMAVGTDGVKRINDALKKVEAFINANQDKDGPRIIDVFGFSRGAALARDFINQIHAKLAGKVTEVGFVGLFDTVGSFGLGGNNIDKRSNNPLLVNANSKVAAMAGAYNFNLSASSATKIVHLTAKNEIRANFDLQSLRSAKGAPLPSNMEEIEVVGVHSDVGGGYGTKPQMTIDRIEQRTLNYFATGVAWQETMLKKKQILLDEAKNRGLTLEYERSVTHANSEVTDHYWLTKKRVVKPGLSNVYLHMMYKKAEGSTVPLIQLKDEFIQNNSERFGFPQELLDLLENNLITPKDYTKLYDQFVHMSHRDWEDADKEKRYIAHYPNSDGKRTIYYSNLNKAIKPIQTTRATN